MLQLVSFLGVGIFVAVLWSQGFFGLPWWVCLLIVFAFMIAWANFVTKVLWGRRYSSTLPSTDILDRIQEIADVKRALALQDQAETSRYRLYVRSQHLAGGAVQYMAGGMIRPNLVFINEADGTRTVKKYQRGDWESKIDDTLSIARALHRKALGQTLWSKEKIAIYEAAETLDYDLLTAIDETYRNHIEELLMVWEQIGRAGRVAAGRTFTVELEREWPTEYLEILSCHEVFLSQQVQSAFLVGYMLGMGWVTDDQVTSFNLWLGREVVSHLRSTLKRVESKAIALATAFAVVAEHGREAADVMQRAENSSPGHEMVSGQDATGI